MDIIPLTEQLYSTYIDVGKKAYDEHYLHLWENQDSRPYHESSFTVEVLQKEEIDDTSQLFVINCEAQPAGILKIIKNSALHPYSDLEGLLLEKIYILKKYTGKGIGREILDFTERKAREYNKKIIWLDTMQNGKALHFYLAYGFEIHAEKMLHFKTVLDIERPMYQLIKTL